MAWGRGAYNCVYRVPGGHIGRRDGVPPRIYHMAFPRQHGESRHSVRRLESVERQDRALELRKQGITYKHIAAEVGVSIQHAGRMVESALRRVLREPAEAVRKLEAERLDAMFTNAYMRAVAGDHGSIYAVLNIMGRRAKLLGLDAPTFVRAGGVNEDGTPWTPEQNAAHVRLLVGSLLPPEPDDSGSQ